MGNGSRAGRRGGSAAGSAGAYARPGPESLRQCGRGLARILPAPEPTGTNNSQLLPETKPQVRGGFPSTANYGQSRGTGSASPSETALLPQVTGLHPPRGALTGHTRPRRCPRHGGCGPPSRASDARPVVGVGIRRAEPGREQGAVLARRTQGESRPEDVGRSTSPQPGVGRQLVRRVLPSARCTVYDHVWAGWSELCLLDGHHAANRLPVTEASMSRPEEVCTVTPVTSLPT